jgi:hypothetical protein
MGGAIFSEGERLALKVSAAESTQRMSSFKSGSSAHMSQMLKAKPLKQLTIRDGNESATSFGSGFSNH